MLDGRRVGPSFQGIGAISGGGGNSRYLVDYPPRQRRAILDELFSPHRGAALQLLKVEIGGDANSSDGSEPSVEQRPGHLTCRVGYELWLARQAVRRDPAIRLYGLQWSAPSWVRGPGGKLWTSRDIQYLLAWLGCARRLGLRIAYLGGWNEHYTPDSPTIESWYVALRRALDRHGYRSVTIVAADDYGTGRKPEWAVANDMADDPAFDRAVGVIGVHDACGARSGGFACRGSPVARLLARTQHKLLWQSELGRIPNRGQILRGQGPAALARALVNAYRGAGITATLLWPIVDAMPPGLPFSNRGLITADQPWSGHYSVSPLLYVVAHTTELTAPGWRFVKGADGLLRGSGSYVTYERPDRREWSMVVQTSLARAPQVLRIHVSGGLPMVARVWLTRLVGDPSIVQVLPRLRPKGDVLSLELAPGSLYTITTIQRAPVAPLPPDPAPHNLRLPYHPTADAAGMARFLAPMEGAFQYVGRTLTQVAVGPPVPWTPCGGAAPYAVVGNASWSHYTVAATVALPRPVPGDRHPGALLIAGFRGFRKPCQFVGYELGVDASGAWRLVRNGPDRVLLGAGRVRPSQRYLLRLIADGRLLVGFIGRRRVARLRLTAPVTGLAGLGSFSYDAVRYDRFAVTPLPTTRPPSRPSARARGASATWSGARDPTTLRIRSLDLTTAPPSTLGPVGHRRVAVRRTPRACPSTRRGCARR